jgi:hypothetical protein
MSLKSSSLVLAAAMATVFMSASVGAESAAPGLDRRPASIDRAAPGVPLAAASRADSKSVVSSYLQARGRSADVLASLRVTRDGVAGNGYTQVRMEQQIEGLTVHGAYLKAAINAQGELVQVIDRLVDVSLVRPSRIDAEQALVAAMKSVHPAEAAAAYAASGASGNTTRFAGGAFFYRDPAVTAVVVPLDNGTLVRGWLVETWSGAANQLHHTVVDGDGRVLDVESRTATDSYNVFVEDPLKGSQATVNGPGAGNIESPLGWLGTGAQTTWSISGNNVKAYLDTDANNAADSGGTAVTSGNFTTSVDLTVQPSTTGNKAVAVQNLFYLNNVTHDRLYASGFTEAAGNFQVSNFSKGGAGNDPVNAEAQDGSGTDNANMSTPSDGSSPRMQMYLWSGNTPSGLVTVGTTNYGAYGSSFGAALTATGVTGKLAVYNDATGVASDGCEANKASLTGMVAIVDRGTCNFTVKVLNAQNAGAKAVIIVNNAADGAFGPGGTDRKVKIPSAMVSLADGGTLKSLAGQDGTLKKNPATPIQLDGDLDSDIVFHEYGHGLTWRMVGGMSGPLAGAIGEGASDVLAFLLNCQGTPPASSTCDDRVGEYAYANSLGIRRYPYQGYPLTYKAVTGAEVHNDGEIYAAAMWKVFSNYAAAGLTRDDMLKDFVGGLDFTPATPTFEQMRDGMLTYVSTNTTRKCAIWKGFAAQGIGVGAKGSVSPRGTVTITESFSLANTGC